MRLSTLFVLVVAPTLLACSSSSSPAKKPTDAATDPVTATDAPWVEDARPDAPVTDTTGGKDTMADTTGIEDAMARDLSVSPDGSEIVRRDGAPIETSRDAGVDLPVGCLAAPSTPPPCNDDPISAAIQGVCQTDGTCRCNPDFTLDPATGRCGRRTGDAATVDGTPTAAQCTGTYDACQCLCCSTDRVAPTCYFPTLGDTVDGIRTTYEASKDPANCGPGSCSATIVRHVCCMPADPESPSSATYLATGYVGGIDRLGITKTGADCAFISFEGGAGIQRPFNIEGGGTWALADGSFGPCGDAGVQAQIQGALGTIVMRKDGSNCVADLHATLFAIDSAGKVTTTRMDGEGIKLPSMISGISCR